MAKTAHYVRLDRALELLSGVLAQEMLSKIKTDLLADQLELPVAGIDDLAPLLDDIERFKQELRVALLEFRFQATKLGERIQADGEKMPDPKLNLLAAFLRLLQEQKIVPETDTDSLMALLRTRTHHEVLSEALKACDGLLETIEKAREDFKDALRILREDKKTEAEAHQASMSRQLVDELLRLLNQYELIEANCLDNLPADVRRRVVQEFLDSGK